MAPARSLSPVATTRLEPISARWAQKKRELNLFKARSVGAISMSLFVPLLELTQYAAALAYFERNPAEVERLASNVIELSTRQNFAHWLAIGAIYRGWARSASGDTDQGISWIEDGIALRMTRGQSGLLFLIAVGTPIAGCPPHRS